VLFRAEGWGDGRCVDRLLRRSEIHETVEVVLGLTTSSLARSSRRHRTGWHGI